MVIADGAPAEPDVTSVVVLHEVFRQLEAVGAWGSGTEVLAGSRIDTGAPGVLVAEDVEGLVGDLPAAPGQHRAWARQEPVTSSATPPVI